MDVIYLLNWLEENEEAIKQRAINALMAHLKRCQSTLGLGEKLSQEDYSFSMMVQMGSGAKTHPTSREEAASAYLTIHTWSSISRRHTTLMMTAKGTS